MKMTLKAFAQSSNIPAALIRSVVRQMGGWQAFMESAPAIANHGIDGGFHGFIYTRETTAFAKRNIKSIQALAAEQAEDFGVSVTEMIQGFGCFRDAKPNDVEIGKALYAGKDDGSGVLNALAWYAAEEVARSFQAIAESDAD